MRNLSFLPCGLWPLASMLARFSRGRLLGVWLGLAGVGAAPAVPAILTQPQSQTNIAGSSIVFSVSATNSATYTSGFNYGDLDGWPHTNVFYTGLTAGTLNFSYLFGPISDRLTVYYGGNLIHDTGYIGGPNTRTFTTNYGPGTATSVTVIINEGNYNNHGSKWEYHLSMLAPIYYQWRNDTGSIAGATNATYTLSNLQTNQAGSYEVVLTDNSGAITSAVATLTVLVPPAFTQQPVGMTVLAGASSNLYVTATGTSPLSYQWQRNGTNLCGATAPSYAFTNAQAADAGNYRVVVTNAAGSATSTTALVQVLIAPNLTNVSGNSTNFSFSYAMVVGSTYIIESKANLNDATWTPVATNTGTGSVTNYFVNTTGGANRFYRVVVR